MTEFCQRCQTEAAKVHVTEIDREGGKVLLHLCEGCAKGHGLPAPTPPTVLAVFKELVDKANTVSRPRDRQCPECGITFAEFKAKGRFGCAHDYDVFLARVVPLLERVHGASEHVGQDVGAPEQAGAARAGAAEPTGGASPAPASLSDESPARTPPPPPKKSAADLAAQELKRLRRDLVRVVKSEAYEEAARLRDRIQELEKELAKGFEVDG
jgi:protein arginine kinase activator